MIKKFLSITLPTLVENKSLENTLQSSSKFANFDFEESAFCKETFPFRKTDSKFSSIAMNKPTNRTMQL